MHVTHSLMFCSCHDKSPAQIAPQHDITPTPLLHVHQNSLTFAAHTLCRPCTISILPPPGGAPAVWLPDGQSQPSVPSFHHCGGRPGALPLHILCEHRAGRGACRGTLWWLHVQCCAGAECLSVPRGCTPLDGGFMALWTGCSGQWAVGSHRRRHWHHRRRRDCTSSSSPAPFKRSIVQCARACKSTSPSA